MKIKLSGYNTETYYRLYIGSYLLGERCRVRRCRKVVPHDGHVPVKRRVFVNSGRVIYRVSHFKRTKSSESTELI